MAEGSTLPHKLPSSPSPPMIQSGDGVAELVWESGQPLARHPKTRSRLLPSRNSCPSQLHKLDTDKYQERIHGGSGKRPRLGDHDQTSLDPIWVEPHVVPDHHHRTSGEAFNNELEAKVPEHHHHHPPPRCCPTSLPHEFDIGWGPFSQMLMDNASCQQQKRLTSSGGHYDHYNELKPQEPTHLLRASRLLKVGDGTGQGATGSCSANSKNGPMPMQMQMQKSTTLADGSSIPAESTLVESGSKSVKALETWFHLLNTRGSRKPMAPPDEGSEAVSCDDDTRGKRAKMEANVAASAPKVDDENPEHRKESVCSLAASNDFVGLEKRHHEDTTGMARGRKKKRRSAEIHSQSEKKRRAKINKKLQVLQDMIPNANKVDRASLLDEAIEYMKGLQLQLQVMAMGRGLMMHPMMLPGFQAPQMAQLPPTGMGVGMNTPTGLGCIPTPLSNSPLLSFPGQVLPLSMPQLPPFGPIPTGGSSSNPSIPMPAVQLLGSALFEGTRDTAQCTNLEMPNTIDRKDGQSTSFQFCPAAINQQGPYHGRKM